MDMNVEHSEAPLFTESANTFTDFINGKKYADLTAEDMIGQEFNSLEEAANFYSTYSRIMGFGVRKQQIKRDRDGEIRKRVWVCDKQGYRSAKWMHMDNRSKEPKPITRVGCGAEFGVTRVPLQGHWIVKKFVPDHSHELLSTHEVPFIRSNRSVNETCLSQAIALHNVGIGTSKIMDYLVDQAGGYENVGFTRKDLHNKFTAQRKLAMLDNDSETVLAHFRTKAEMDPDLFYMYTVDEENRLANIFWVDSTGRFDYGCFGDVLAFDATYRTNAYGKPLVILVGVNNHNRTTIFGMALLVDETVETYTWVLNTFLLAMQNKHPRSVITDGDKAMRKAIKDVFPNSYHRLCTWHLERNAQANLHDSRVVRAFTDCMLGEYTKNEFEARWLHMLDKFSLHTKEWLVSMHATRDMWAEAFMKGTFFAGMRTTQRCESMNAYLNKFVQDRQKLYEFMISIDKAIRRMRNQEVEDDVKCKVSTVVPTTHLRQIEKHAAQVYTRRIFKKVRDQIKEDAVLIKCNSMEYGDRRVYTLTKHMHPELKWTVVYYSNDKHIQCSCNIFDSTGIPCSHSFYIMKEEHLGEIPESLIHKRWRQDAKIQKVQHAGVHGLSDDAASSLRYGSLSVDCNKLCLFGSKTDEGYQEAKIEIARLTSRMEQVLKVYEDTQICMGDNKGKNVLIKDPLVVKTKGRSYRPAKEDPKERRCSRCRMVGHTKRTCEKEVNMDISGVSSRRRDDAIDDGVGTYGNVSSPTIDFTNREFMHNVVCKDDVAIDLTPPMEFDSQPTHDMSFDPDIWWMGCRR